MNHLTPFLAEIAKDLGDPEPKFVLADYLEEIGSKIAGEMRKLANLEVKGGRYRHVSTYVNKQNRITSPHHKFTYRKLFPVNLAEATTLHPDVYNAVVREFPTISEVDVRYSSDCDLIGKEGISRIEVSRLSRDFERDNWQKLVDQGVVNRPELHTIAVSNASELQMQQVLQTLSSNKNVRQLEVSCSQIPAVEVAQNAIQYLEVFIPNAEGMSNSLANIAQSMPNIRGLRYTHHRANGNLEAIAQLPNLQFLILSGLEDVHDFSPLVHCKHLEFLCLEQMNIPSNAINTFPELPSLKVVSFQNLRNVFPPYSFFDLLKERGIKRTNFNWHQCDFTGILKEPLPNETV